MPSQIHGLVPASAFAPFRVRFVPKVETMQPMKPGNKEAAFRRGHLPGKLRGMANPTITRMGRHGFFAAI
jgi:hypothetical protein